MRELVREPEISDFMSAGEYESSVPASFGLPEYPVLFLKEEVEPSFSIWCASDGVHVWNRSLRSGQQFEPSSCAIHESVLNCPGLKIPVPEISAKRLNLALAKCAKMFDEGETDSIEIAVPLEYEAGEADDLGDSRLAQSIGQGMQSREGPSIAEKRRRSS